MPTPEPIHSKTDARSRRTKERLVVIGPGQADRHYWRDLWSSRELLAILAWRDFAVRYKQTALGVAWAVVRPLLTVVVLTLVFSRIAKLQSDGHSPYILMVCAGMLPWFLVSTIIGEASNGLVNNAELIGKVYFPRLIIPSASLFVSLVDFVVSSLFFVAISIWFQFWPDWRILYLPFFVIMALLTALGPALFLAALNVKYRDFRSIIPFLLQFALYISPVGFSSAVVPEQWRLLYSLNPVVGVIDGFRWCLLRGEASLYLPGFTINLCTIGLFLIGGLVFFRRSERNFADVL